MYSVASFASFKIVEFSKEELRYWVGQPLADNGKGSTWPALFMNCPTTNQTLKIKEVMNPITAPYEGKKYLVTF